MTAFSQRFIAIAVALAALYAVASALNTRPIIGILDQPTHGEMARIGSSYIAASYVKVHFSRIPLPRHFKSEQKKLFFDFS
jgi:hypothetical protein